MQASLFCLEKAIKKAADFLGSNFPVSGTLESPTA